jgi:hypothetical protein
VGLVVVLGVVVEGVVKEAVVVAWVVVVVEEGSSRNGWGGVAAVVMVTG